MACGILVPWPGIKPVPPALKAQSLDHWTTREAPEMCLVDLHLSLTNSLFCLGLSFKFLSSFFQDNISSTFSFYINSQIVCSVDPVPATPIKMICPDRQQPSLHPSLSCGPRVGSSSQPPDTTGTAGSQTTTLDTSQSLANWIPQLHLVASITHCFWNPLLDTLCWFFLFSLWGFA